MENYQDLMPPAGTSPVLEAQLKDNAIKYLRCTLDPKEASELRQACDKIEKIESEHKLYSGLAHTTGIEQWAVAGVHYRESSCSMAGCFQNGDLVIGPDAMARGLKTIHVPKGLGPWPTVLASGIDAFRDELKAKGWRHAPVGVADSLAFTERFNGLGPRRHGIDTGYNWGGTSEEDRGGYSNDGEWDENRDETRIGVVAIMKEMKRRELAVGPAPIDPPPAINADPAYTSLMNLALANKVPVTPVRQLIDLHAKKFPGRYYCYWAVIDFTKHSSEKRLYFFDLASNTVERHLVAHGSGSDPGNTGYATRFSNTDGSHMSNLGICQAQEIYNGNHGASLRLNGLEATNSHMRDRAIVMHQSAYVNDAEGVCGRSWGCPAVDPKYKDKLITSLRGGSLINIWKE